MGGRPPGKRRRAPRVTPEALTRAAHHYLERYATSVENLRRVLQRRVARAARLGEVDEAAAVEAIEAILARLTEVGVLDDRAYAAARARSLHRRGASARAIRARLTRTGVDPDLLGPAIEARSAGPGDAELLAALAFARRRRLGPYRSQSERAARRARDLAALARQGFDYDVALKVIDAPDGEALEAEAETGGY